MQIPRFSGSLLDAIQQDACKATYVSAWMLRRGFNRYGNSWFAAAAYHSTTPVHNLRYQGLLKAELARQGVNLVVATAD